MIEALLAFGRTKQIPADRRYQTAMLDHARFQETKLVLPEINCQILQTLHPPCHLGTALPPFRLRIVMRRPPSLPAFNTAR